MNISAKELAQWLDGSRKVEVVDVRREYVNRLLRKYHNLGKI